MKQLQEMRCTGIALGRCSC